jgi:hypothetical protein
MGKNLGQTKKFERFLDDLGSQCSPKRFGYCQVCGRSPIVGQTDRCWFPLSGSGDSDPCTLPGLSGKTICAECLSAVVVLPLGCRWCREGPYFIQLTEPDLQVEAVAEGVSVIHHALAANASDDIRHRTNFSGRLALLTILSGSILWDHSQPGHLSRIPHSGATIISFNNKGNGPCFHELHLPAQALEFFSALAEAGARSVFAQWAEQIQQLARKRKRRDYLDQLCDGVEMRRSLAPLLTALVKSRKDGKLRKEERQVLQIYEDVALRKKERFDALERIAGKVKQMPFTYRDSFVKQLGNTSSQGRFLELLKKFSKSEKTGLSITAYELRIIADGPAGEIINLLYLLCVADD